MKNIFEWDLIETNKTNGQIKISCPVCDHKKTKSLSVNLNKGVAKCHYCEAISIRDKESIEGIKPDYTLPEQNWNNYTELSDAMVKWIENERKIQQFTLKELRVTQEEYYQPQLGKKVNNIVYNYFEGDVLVNKKYRSGGKHFTQSKNGKSIFYNINAAIGEKEVFIVEGEFDVLAMHQSGYKNVISLPNGANDNDDVWINSEKYLSDVEKFYIATDNDTKGELVADKIVQRLGKYRCVRVLFKHKDANETLIVDSESGLARDIANAKKYPSSGTYTIDDLYDGIIELYDNGTPETMYPKRSCFGNLSDHFKVMRGHLVTGTGIPSHGKSNFTEWYILNLVQDHRLKASFFSPEHHPMELHQSTFIEKFHGKNFWMDNPGCPRISKEDILTYSTWAKEKIYTTAPEKGEFPTWDWLLEKFKEQMFIYGIDIFVIDAFNKLEFNNNNASELSNIKSVLTKLTMFAQMNNVIIFLIAHPTKMTKNPDGAYNHPDLYSVSGSADFRNQTHDGFSVFRYFAETIDPNTNEIIKKNQVSFRTEKVKMKFQGEIGASTYFNYHLPSGRYYVGSNEPTFRLDQEPQKFREESAPVYVVQPHQAFDINSDEVPF